jgi:hypothetical protein
MSLAPKGQLDGWHVHRQRPTTSAGAWSVRLVDGGLAVVIFLVLFMAVTVVRVEVGPVSLLGLTAFGGLLVVIAGGVFAIRSIFRSGERSIFVVATLPVWVIAILLVVGELAVSH